MSPLPPPRFIAFDLFVVNAEQPEMLGGAVNLAFFVGKLQEVGIGIAFGFAHEF